MLPRPDCKKKGETEIVDVFGEDETLGLVELYGVNSVVMPQMAGLTDDVVRSEVNFLVLPFFALWNKDVKRRIEAECQLIIKRGGEKLEIVWNVSANPRFGYPGPFDKRVYKAVEQIIGELPRPIENNHLILKKWLSKQAFYYEHDDEMHKIRGKKFDEVSKIRLKIEEVICERVKQKRTK